MPRVMNAQWQKLRSCVSPTPGPSHSSSPRVPPGDVIIALQLKPAAIRWRPTCSAPGNTSIRLLMRGAENEVYSLSGESIVLEVRRANQAARQLYFSMGFDEVGVREGYYSDGESAIVMRKFLEK